MGANSADGASGSTAACFPKFWDVSAQVHVYTFGIMHRLRIHGLAFGGIDDTVSFCFI